MKLKQIFNLSILLTFFISTSCVENKLNLKVVENDDIRIEKYSISEITTIHEFIDIKSKTWKITERILEANDGSIDSIFINQDTLFLRKTSSQAVIYDSLSTKFGYKIILLEPTNE